MRGRIGSCRIAILAITEGEFLSVKRIFNAQNSVIGTPYFVEAISHDGDYDIAVRRSSDRGNHAAGEAIGDFVEDLRPGFIFLLGTAGGHQGRDDVELGDVVVVDFVAYSELRKWSEGKDLQRYIAYDHPSLYVRENFAEPLRFDERWKQLIGTTRPVLGTPKVIIGSLVAGEKLLGDAENEYQVKLLEEFDKAVAFDMESFGVAREVFKRRNSVHYNPQYCVVRGISDFVNKLDADRGCPGFDWITAFLQKIKRLIGRDKRQVTSYTNQETREEWRDYAASAAAAFAKILTSNLLVATQQDANPVSQHDSDRVQE